MVLGIDLGTSYLKTILVRHDGTVAATTRRRTPTREPSPVRRELDSAAFFACIEAAVAEACSVGRCSPAEIEGVSYASQANSVVLIDRDGAAITPIIVWNDTRVAESDIHPAVKRLFARPEFGKVTGVGVASPELAIAKLGWFVDNEPALWQQTAHIAPISELLVSALTGHPRGDQATTALLGIWNVQAEEYWPAAVNAAGIAGREPATVSRPGTIVGATEGALARRLGLSPSCVMSVGSLDHHAAALGAGVGEATGIDACESSGTVLAGLSIGTTFAPAAGIVVGPSWNQHEYYTLSFDSSGAPSEEALRRGLLDVYEAPTARLSNLLGRLNGGAMPRRVVSTGGGARSDYWMQLKADVCGVPFVRAPIEEPAAYGAAVFAAVAAGWYSSVDRCRGDWASAGYEEFSPTG